MSTQQIATAAIDPKAGMAEFTLRAVVVGAILGLVFGASSLYLVLKVGLTVSASIPVAVLAITLFRILGATGLVKRTTILENNILQTTGSAGESIAFGVGVTMPALMLIGFDMDLPRVMMVSVMGGLLGILMMIPLRRLFIVKMHGAPGQPNTLLYPEGTACAKVLESAERGGAQGGAVMAGFAIAFGHKLISEGAGLLKAGLEAPLGFFSRVARVSSDMGVELLGVGYIIGLRVSALMLAGSILGALVLLPSMAFFGDGRDGVLPPSTAPIGQMGADKMQGTYLRFIGAGCVAAAGIFSLIKTLPTIFGAIFSTLGMGTKKDGQALANGGPLETPRTEKDLPPMVVAGGVLVLAGLLAWFLAPQVGLWGAIGGSALVLFFGFLFVMVSSRLTGEIGSSSNPISGMTIATLLLTCLIFLSLGMTGSRDALLALSIGGVVCIAASNGGTTSQDLKTGFLVGGTPYLQQYAILVGALTSALVIGGTLLLFNQAGEVLSTRDLPSVNVKQFEAEISAGNTRVLEGVTYREWRTTKAQRKELPGLGDAKYLVDPEGNIAFLVDPTITGRYDKRDKFVAESNARVVPGLAAVLGEVTSNARVEGKTMKLVTSLEPSELDKRRGEAKKSAASANDPALKVAEALAAANIAPGDYLVDGVTAALVYKNDPEKVKMKFGAPKTQVMGLIIQGVLGGDINWTLVLIGAMISLTLEMCGVSSLAFAVGVYVPMGATMPIFIGGLARWAADRAHAVKIPEGATEAEKQNAEVERIAKTESSPGVLWASGLIAGGSLGGVLLAFLEFAPGIKNLLEQQHLVESWGLGKWHDLITLGIFLALAMSLVVLGRKSDKPRAEGQAIEPG